MSDKTGECKTMEKPSGADSSHRMLDDTNVNLGIIKEENVDTLYNIKGNLDDEENVSLLTFIHDDKSNLDVKPCLYNCTACTMQFTELEKLEEHFATHENDNVCAFCDKKFLHEYHFKLHLDNHLEKEKQDTLNKLKQEDESCQDIENDCNNGYRTQITLEHNYHLKLHLDHHLEKEKQDTLNKLEQEDEG